MFTSASDFWSAFAVCFTEPVISTSFGRSGSLASVAGPFDGSVQNAKFAGLISAAAPRRWGFAAGAPSGFAAG